MVSALLKPSARTAGLVLATTVLTLTLAGSVNSLPGFSDRTGPTELAVTGFERLDEAVSTRCRATLARRSVAAFARRTP